MRLRSAWNVLAALRDPGTGNERIRHTMVLLAVLPAALVCLIAAAAWLVHGSGMTDSPDGAEWDLLTGTALLACAVLAGGGILAGVRARDISARYAEQGAELGRYAERGHTGIAAMANGLRRGTLPERTQEGPPPALRGSVLEEQAAEVNIARRSAETAVLELAAAARAGDVPGGAGQSEMFAALARGLGSLVHREAARLEEWQLEKSQSENVRLEESGGSTGDRGPSEADSRIDHLAVRLRRYAENLAVLGGSTLRRRWNRPATVGELLRTAIAEARQPPRVRPVATVEATVRAHAASDVVHLLAELADNATKFSASQTGVLLRAERVTAGLAIEVEDRGEGMTSAERNTMNSLLSSPERFALDELLREGRVGLYVVSRLAERHRISVRLQENIYGGTQAVLVLPHEIVDGRPDDRSGREGESDADDENDSDGATDDGNCFDGGNRTNGANGTERQPIENRAQRTESEQPMPENGELKSDDPAGREAAQPGPRLRQPPETMPAPEPAPTRTDPADETTVLPPVPADETAVLPPVPTDETAVLPPVPAESGSETGPADEAGSAEPRDEPRKRRASFGSPKWGKRGGTSNRPRVARPGRPDVPARPSVPSAPTAPGLPGDLTIPSGPSVPRGPVVPKGMWRDERPEGQPEEQRGGDPGDSGRSGQHDEPGQREGDPEGRNEKE